MKTFLKENYIYLILIIGIILVRIFIITPVRVNGTSMNNTLANGDVLLLEKLDKLQREDIVVISGKVEGDPLIKRIIALPKETIECKDGKIYINDKLYDDNYANGITSDFARVTLKEDEYFVLGDNRIVSEDSRYLGPINKKYIKGTCNIRLFPFDKFGSI